MAACSSNATPTATQSEAALYFVSGSHYEYATVTYGKVIPAEGTPSPIPTGTSSDSTVLTTNASFEGTKGLVKVEYLQKIAAKGETRTLQSNNYYVIRSQAGATFLEHLGTNSPGITLAYTSPAVVLEEPFRAGNHWDPSASYRLQSKMRDETWNRDGSYDSSYVVSVKIGSAPPTVEHVREVVNSDGSATLVSRTGNCVPLTWRIGVPVSSNGKYVIPYKVRQARTCHGRAIATNSFGVDWYPGGGQPPQPLERSSVTDEGSATIPASCHVPASIAAKGEKIVRSDTSLDPFGTISQSTDTKYYAQPRGLVCNVNFRTQKSYSIFTGPGLLQTVKTAGVRSMQRFSSAAGAALPSDVLVDVTVRIKAAADIPAIMHGQVPYF